MREEERAFLSLLFKGANATMKASPPPRLHLQMPSHWGLGFPHMNFGVAQTFSPRHQVSNPEGLE